VVDDWGEETSGEANVAKSWPATPADLPLRATLVLRHAERDDPPVRRGDVPRPVSGIYLHRVGKHAPLPLTPSAVDSLIRFA
jgi:hypothetical protein